MGGEAAVAAASGMLSWELAVGTFRKMPMVPFRSAATKTTFMARDCSAGLPKMATVVLAVQAG